jgi:hypothetical protein
MTKLSTIPQHQLSITCGLCKHHTMLEVANLMAVVGGDTIARVPPYSALIVGIITMIAHIPALIRVATKGVRPRRTQEYLPSVIKSSMTCCVRHYFRLD